MVFTRMESAAIASLLAFILGMFVYKEMKLEDLPKILISTAITTSVVTFIISMATILGWILSSQHFYQPGYLVRFKFIFHYFKYCYNKPVARITFDTLANE